MTEIDPQAVFISDDGEVVLCPQHAGSVAVHRLKHPIPAHPWPALPDENVETVLYDTLHVLPERAQKAICRLLRERDERDALLDECASFLWSAYTRRVPAVPDPRLDGLMRALYRREDEKQWRQR